MSETLCCECGAAGASGAPVCVRCGAPSPDQPDGPGIGCLWQTSGTWLGVPWVQIAFGMDAQGQPRVARGIVAIGQRARGVLAIGLMATGVFAIGFVALGAVSLGVVAVAGLAACGVNALAPWSFGVAAIGYWAGGLAPWGWHILAPATALPPHATREVPRASECLTSALATRFGMCCRDRLLPSSPSPPRAWRKSVRSVISSSGPSWERGCALPRKNVSRSPRQRRGLITRSLGPPHLRAALLDGRAGLWRNGRSMNRSLLSSLCAAALLAAPAFAAEPIPEANKISGFAIGCQAYCFKDFTLFEAIDKTAEVGAKVIEFFPGQALSKEEPSVKWGHDAAPETIAKVKAKLAEKGIIPVAYGVVGIPKDEGGARKVFEFARKMGIRVINTESVDSIDTFEKLVKEYDIKVGFHDHPKRPNDANYKMWDPNYILSVVKDRDPRIGSCADTGHWQRSELDPVECLRILKGHIVSSHLKDLNVRNAAGHDMPYGTGSGNIAGTLAEFAAQGFSGPISVEYEYHMKESVPEIKQCFDFMRAYKPAK